MIDEKAAAMPFAVMNRLVNPAVSWLLRSPFHGMASKSLLLLAYTGTKSGCDHSLPAQYAEDPADGTLVILVGDSEAKRWWKNFRKPAPVRILVRGASRDAEAVALTGSADAAAVASKLDVYLRRFPSVAARFGIFRDASGRLDPLDLQVLAEKTVVVVVTPEEMPLTASRSA